MSDAWAVVVGAAIAVIGSVATQLTLNRHEDAKTARAVARDDARERRNGLGTAIQELCEALLDKIIRADSEDGALSVTCRVMMAQLRLGLFLTQSDQPIVLIAGDTVNKVLKNDTDALAAVSALTSVLPAWRRDYLTAWDALDAYRRDTGAKIVIEDEKRHRETARLEAEVPRTRKARRAERRS